MNILSHPRKLPVLALALTLLLFAVPALSESEAQAVVSVDSMDVYAEEAPHARLGALPRGTVVTVTARSGEAALIRYNGYTGVARASELSAVESAAPQAQAAEATTMVTNRETRIYKKASKSSGSTKVPAGASVEVLAVNGNCARVSRNGKVGYMVYSHLGDSAPEQAAADDTPVRTGSAPVVTARSSRVTANADGTGGSVTLEKGVKLTLLAIKGDCAMVEKDGAIGYTSVGNLEKASAAKETVRTSNPFSAGSNEAVIYSFLTGEMGYNRAAAMGVMANIKYESGYRPTLPGDSGTSYGLCQWHAGRKTNLINYCAEHGLDYSTVEGQLQFFKYEITTRYPSVHSYLKGVENTAEGAYDAGYYFCFNFEAPAARTSQSTKRGEYAKNTLFEM